MSIQGTELRAAYAEQNPLVITGTVRSNILYGSPYDQEYYEKVVQACQLGADFDRFPKRDLTETGEMGVALSEVRSQEFHWLVLYIRSMQR